MIQIINGIHLPDSDTHFPDMILRGPLYLGKGTYQLNKLDAGIKLCETRRRVAIDVGAHVGLWTRVLSYHFDRVYAFEPMPEHVECFALNCVDLPNVVLHDGVVLGETPATEQASMVSVQGNSGNAHVAAHGVPGALTLPTRPLDAYFTMSTEVDFIKIDVEGQELAVVRGGEQLIRRCQPAMVVEQKPGNAERYGWRTGEVLDLLRSWGARVAWTRSGDHGITWG